MRSNDALKGEEAVGAGQAAARGAGLWGCAGGPRLCHPWAPAGYFGVAQISRADSPVQDVCFFPLLPGLRTHPSHPWSNPDDFYQTRVADAHLLSYIQISGMVFGGMIEADNHLRVYEANMRLRRKEMRNQMVRAAYERELQELEGGRPLEPQDEGEAARPKR
ncbi:hypothetical protein MAPG_09114 [Magnaporthiopsis poae ATCC 64411]|uniref:Uncharacterized protein n=1 Tax=Magnaporthiopsis poae (strain ATCC 64411 / 73-15) TaxID=644358 RepID=A0A0C4E937_MAGP6|nr:hypothetical protein MAPG_09114 [Magnaporthiopsis poae ATCC 64411]